MLHDAYFQIYTQCKETDDGKSAVRDLFHRHGYVCLFNDSTVAVISDFSFFFIRLNVYSQSLSFKYSDVKAAHVLYISANFE